MTTTDDTSVGLMHRETQRFSTSSGPLVLTASSRDILVSFRPSGNGSMWLGAWRYTLKDQKFDGLALHTDIRFSDALCRCAREHGGQNTSPMSCYAGQAPVVPETEIVVMSRVHGAFIANRTWVARQARKNRKAIAHGA